MKAAAMKVNKPNKSRAAANSVFQKKDEPKGVLGAAYNQPWPAAGRGTLAPNGLGEATRFIGLSSAPPDERLKSIEMSRENRSRHLGAVIQMNGGGAYSMLEGEEEGRAQVWEKVGHDLTNVYRHIKAATKGVKEKKITQALINAGAGLALSATSLATTVSPISGIGADAIAQSVVKAGIDKGVESQISAPHSDIMGKIQDTSTTRAQWEKLVRDKFGSPKKVAHTVTNLIPLVAGLKVIVAAAEKGLTDRDKFNISKADIIVAIDQVIAVIETEVLDKLTLDALDIAVVTARKITGLLGFGKKRKLGEIVDKFKSSVAEYRSASREFSEKHSDVLRLIHEEFTNEEAWDQV
jgi:hypothetical protein